MNSKYKIEFMASVTAHSSKFEWYQITPISIELNFWGEKNELIETELATFKRKLLSL